MQSSEYVVGRLTEGGEPAGEAHAVAVEAARGSTSGFRAECGKQMDVVRGGSWPSEADAGGRCPVCSRLTGA